MSDHEVGHSHLDVYKSSDWVKLENDSLKDKKIKGLIYINKKYVVDWNKINNFEDLKRILQNTTWTLYNTEDIKDLLTEVEYDGREL